MKISYFLMIKFITQCLLNTLVALRNIKLKLGTPLNDFLIYKRENDIK